MCERFIKWLIGQLEDQDEEDRALMPELLYVLKFKPEEAARNISNHLPDWLRSYASHKKVKKLELDPTNDPREIVKALQKHWATELATISESQRF